MKTTRPLIAVTGPSRNHRLSWWCLRYLLWKSGADLLKVTPRNPSFDAKVDAVIITGGTDVLPESYGGTRKEHYRYDAARDAVESAWIARADKERLPLLGICRGAQLINVCRGGTLHSDIKLVCESARHPGGVWSKVSVRKPIVVKDGSLLARLFGVTALMVNSLHRQSLDTIGEGLSVTAWEENSIVQAIETTRPDHFVLGVQWHPEFMLCAAGQRAIFAKLVHEAQQTGGQPA